MPKVLPITQTIGLILLLLQQLLDIFQGDRNSTIIKYWLLENTSALKRQVCLFQPIKQRKCDPRMAQKLSDKFDHQ